jgi:hypothetical protein
MRFSRYGFPRNPDRSLSATQNKKIATNERQNISPLNRNACIAIVIGPSLFGLLPRVRQSRTGWLE